MIRFSKKIPSQDASEPKDLSETEKKSKIGRKNSTSSIETTLWDAASAVRGDGSVFDLHIISAEEIEDPRATLITVQLETSDGKRLTRAVKTGVIFESANPRFDCHVYFKLKMAEREGAFVRFFLYNWNPLSPELVGEATILVSELTPSEPTELKVILAMTDEVSWTTITVSGGPQIGNKAGENERTLYFLTPADCSVSGGLDAPLGPTGVEQCEQFRKRWQSCGTEAMKAAFALFDTDSSGQLDLAKLMTILKASGADPLSEQEAAAVVERLDTDGTGKLLIDRFLSGAYGLGAATEFSLAQVVLSSPACRGLLSAAVALRGHPAIESNGIQLRRCLRPLARCGEPDRIAENVGKAVSSRAWAELGQLDESLCYHATATIKTDDVESEWWTDYDVLSGEHLEEALHQLWNEVANSAPSNGIILLTHAGFIREVLIRVGAKEIDLHTLEPMKCIAARVRVGMTCAPELISIESLFDG